MNRLLHWWRRSPTAVTPAGSQAGLDDNPLVAIGQLELIARTTVDGLLSGKHRSTHRGGCTDFAEHRPYAQGDDLRRIDWRLHARNDRYHVKTYDDETNLRAMLVVDSSGSMAFGGHGSDGEPAATKFEQAKIVAACFGRLFVRQRDAVGLAIVGQKVENTLPPRVKAESLTQINETLARANITGEARLGDCLTELASRNRRKGMLVLLTDGFCQLDELKTGLLAWVGRGSDVVIVETLAADELAFNFREPVLLECLERPGLRLEVDPGTLREQYLERLAEHRTAFHDVVTGCGGEVITVVNDQPVGPVLKAFLQRRAAMAMSGRRG